MAYVLNGGTPMCTGVGPQPEITGFTFDADGQLTPIPGSTRPLSGLPNSGSTQVAFDKTGKVVIVEEQQADVITTYLRRKDGTLSEPMPQQSNGGGPFGLTLTQRNQVLTTGNFGAAPAQGGLASYAIDERTGTLTPLSPTVRKGQSDRCWVAITDDNRFAFTSSFGDDGGISSYRVRPDGSLELLNSQAATVGSGSSDVAQRQQSFPRCQEQCPRARWRPSPSSRTARSSSWTRTGTTHSAEGRSGWPRAVDAALSRRGTAPGPQARAGTPSRSAWRCGCRPGRTAKGRSAGTARKPPTMTSPC